MSDRSLAGWAGEPDPFGGEDYDVLVVGAGFAGINALYNFRQQGLRTLLVEAGSGVGGTWFWNRYPGARVDVESLEYSYGFSDELQQEWEWSEKYSSQPEVLRYLEWVTDRLDLRADMRFHRRVTSLHLDETLMRWTATVSSTDSENPSRSARLSCRYVVLATGFLSSPNFPVIPGLESFTGDLVHTGAWPREGVQLAGRAIGVIGTAASGVQVIQETCALVKRLTVFQRSANWCLPLRNQTMAPEYQAFVKANYPEIRRLAQDSRGPGMVLMDGRIVPSESRRAMDLAPEERIADFEWRWNAGGVHMGRGFVDLVVDEDANDELRRFLEAKIREIVDDPEVAELLIPDHPPLTRRPPGESGYYRAFNRANVELVDIRSDPIAAVTPTGVRLRSGRHFDVEVLVCATGFDSGTGAALRIDIRGREGISLREYWADGARTHLGMMISRFPNMFLLNGPQSPGPHFSPPVLADFQSRHVGALIAAVDKAGAAAVEPHEDAQAEWVDHLNAVYARTLIPKTDSWWMGANIPGKPRQALAYGGGFPEYRRRCQAALEELSEYELI